MSHRLAPIRHRLERIRRLREQHPHTLAQLPTEQQDAVHGRHQEALVAMLAETQVLVDQLRPGLEGAASAAHARSEPDDAGWLDDGGGPLHVWQGAELDELNELEGRLRAEAEHDLDR